MKPIIALLFVSILTISCTKKESRTTTLLDYIPNNPSVVLHAKNITTLTKELNESELIKQFNNTKTYKKVKHDFQFLNSIESDNSIIISYAEVGKSLEYLFTINSKNTLNKLALQAEKNNYNNTNYHKLKNQNAFNIVLDSTIVVTSSEILMENLIRNRNSNIRYSNKSLLKLFETANTNKTTAFINLENKPSFFTSVFPTNYLGTNDWVSAEITNDDGLSINGIGTNVKTAHSIASKLLNATTEKSTITQIIPSNFTKLTSYNFNELKLESPFKNFNELSDNCTEITSFSDGKNNLCAFKLLNNNITNNLIEHSTYRNYIIYKNEYYKIPASICKPQPVFACSIADFELFSDSLESIQNCISHHQNNTTLSNLQAYSENSEELLTEAHITQTTTIKPLLKKLANSLNDQSIATVKLTSFPLAMHQITYEDNYIQFNSVLKKITPKKNTATITQIANITLDAPILSEIQWVTNHRTKEKELLVQDADNKLYLISNKGTIVWKKQLNSKIQGKAIQVDLYKNRKLQLAFTTQNEFMILDRNGNLVEPFYKKFDKADLLPLSVFDYDNNRNYRFLITQQNKLFMFDNKFKPLKGFEFTTTKSNVLESPKHIRIGTKDYIIVAEKNGKLHILNRQGKNRTNVKNTFDFSSNTSLERFNNSLLFKNNTNEITQVNIATGAISKLDILQGNQSYYCVKNKLTVKLEDQNLSIKKNTIELDLGNYTRPKVFYINNKFYVTITDVDTQKVYLFNSNATLLDKFPVYGLSTAEITNMDKDRKLEFAVKGDANAILIYKMY